MRIGTYNVLSMHGFPREEAAAALGEPGSPAQIEHFSQVFKTLDCDVLMLQEGGVSSATIQAIARNLNMHLATFPSPGKWPGQALSRFPIIESRVFSHFHPTEPTPLLSRHAGAALIAAAPGVRLWVVGIHLHPADVKLRAAEAETVAHIVRQLQSQEGNVVVLGDFNCEITEDMHRLLAQQHFVNAMVACGGGLRPTIDSVGKKLRCIDHIYVSAPLASRLRSAHVVRAPGFRSDGPQVPGLWVHSDHLPVIAELDWP